MNDPENVICLQCRPTRKYNTEKGDQYHGEAHSPLPPPQINDAFTNDKIILSRFPDHVIHHWLMMMMMMFSKIGTKQLALRGNARYVILRVCL